MEYLQFQTGIRMIEYLTHLLIFEKNSIQFQLAHMCPLVTNQARRQMQSWIRENRYGRESSKSRKLQQFVAIKVLHWVFCSLTVITTNGTRQRFKRREQPAGRHTAIISFIFHSTPTALFKRDYLICIQVDEIDDFACPAWLLKKLCRSTEIRGGHWFMCSTKYWRSHQN